MPTPESSFAPFSAQATEGGKASKDTQRMHGLAPDHPEKGRIDAAVAEAKRRIQEIKDDESLTRVQKQRKAKEVLEWLKEEQKLKGRYGERGEGITVEVPDREVFKPMVKRRHALREMAQAKGNEIEDGIHIDDESGEVTFDFEAHTHYWNEFWSQYDLEYTPEGEIDQEQTENLLTQGMDFVMGIPDISPQKLREIYEQEGMQFWSPERLDLPNLNRKGLPQENYPLALKIAKEIAQYETEGDKQLKMKEINFAAAQKEAKDRGLRGLSYKEYALIQLWYHKMTGEYIDKDSWTWLLDQQAPSPGLAARADYRGSKVHLRGLGTLDSYDRGGVRLSDIVTLKT